MAAADIERPTQLGAIREIHRAHEVRIADARLMRRARVAITDRSVRKGDVAALVERCGGQLVREKEEATIVVAEPEAAAGRKKGRGRSRQRVVDEAGLRQLVAAYEAVYAPPSLLEAARRARQRLAADLLADQLVRDQQRQAKASRRTREAAAKGSVTEAELKLEETVRGMRAKNSNGRLVRR